MTAFRSFPVPSRGLARAVAAALFLSLAFGAGAPAFAQPKPGKPGDKPVDKPAGKDDPKKPGTPPPADKPKSDELGLAVGENKTIPAQDVKQYSEGTPGVVDVKITPDNQRFVIVGQKPGSTTLLLIKNDGSQFTWNINVFSKAPELVQKELEELLQNYPGMRVRRVGPRLFIEGGVATEQERERIRQIAALYSGQVESLVTVGSGAIDRKINIRIDFFFVEYQKSSGYQFGLNYPANIGGGSGAPTNLTATIDFAAKTASVSPLVVTQPLPTLDIASSRGWAKIVKQAAVVTTNGNEATFDSTGEVNFPVNSGFSAQIQAIQFGTSVSVLPRYDPESKNLEVKVGADVQDLTPPAGGTSIPGRIGAKLSTLVYLKLGQALVLSGIHQHAERHSISGIPYLSAIPVLGILFGTHGDTKEDLEGAVFIIPSVVESVPKTNFDILKDALDQYEGYDGDINDVKAFQRTPPSYGAPVK